MKKLIQKKLLWLIPILFVSCAHTTTQESYQKMYAKIFNGGEYVLDKTKPDLGDHGFVIEGTLLNRPYNLVVVFEYTPENLTFIDSARTDSTGYFRMQKVLGNEQICYIQFGERLGFPTALNNQSKMNLKIKTVQGGVSYLLEGSHIESAKAIKKLTEINSGYLYKLNTLQRQVMGYDKNVTTKEQLDKARLNMAAMEGERQKAIIAEMNAAEPSAAPYFALKFLLQEPDYKTINQAYLKCKKYDEQMAYTQILKSWAETEQTTAIGSPAPEISQKTPQGKTLKLSSLKGKVVLIDFWASWCRPCMISMPALKKTYAKYKDQGFEIYGVSLDRDSSRWANTITTQKLVWKHVSDLKYWSNAAAKKYSVHGIPATFLIDKNGNIAGKNLHGTALELKIEELLAKKAD